MPSDRTQPGSVGKIDRSPWTAAEDNAYDLVTRRQKRVAGKHVVAGSGWSCVCQFMATYCRLPAEMEPGNNQGSLSHVFLHSRRQRDVNRQQVGNKR